jgi:hypothetical protein
LRINYLFRRRSLAGQVLHIAQHGLRQAVATVLGAPAAADLAHLLAELLESALLYSPPDQRVVVHGVRQSGGYAIAIIDAGVGLPSDELVAANRRLAGAESFTVAPSRYLGRGYRSATMSDESSTS